MAHGVGSTMNFVFSGHSVVDLKIVKDHAETTLILCPTAGKALTLCLRCTVFLVVDLQEQRHGKEQPRVPS